MGSWATIRIEMSPKLHPSSSWWDGLKQVFATHGYLSFQEAMVHSGKPPEWHFVSCEELDEWSDNTKSGISVVICGKQLDGSVDYEDGVLLRCVWNSAGMQFLRVKTQFSMGQVAYLPAEIGLAERLQRLAFDLHQFHGAQETFAIDDYCEEPLFRFTRDKLEYMLPLQIRAEE